MKIYNKGECFLDAKAGAVKLRRTMILNNVKKEFYHQDVPKSEQMVSATLDTETNELIVTINLDKIKKLIN